jgi:phosphoglucosamine mutase
VLKAIVASGRSLSDLLSGMKRLPQVMINVPLPETSLDLAGDNPVSAICREVESALEGRGRLLLRPSGTEPVIRVMVEGDDAVEIKQLAEQVADVIRCA